MRSESGQNVTIGFLEEEVETGRRHHVPAEHGNAGVDMVMRRSPEEQRSRSLRGHSGQGAVGAELSEPAAIFGADSNFLKRCICDSQLLQALSGS